MNSPLVLGDDWTVPSSPEELRRAVEAIIGEARDGQGPEHENAAIYARVSVVDPRAKGYSMEVQPDRAEEYTRSNGWHIVGVYEDPDRTGRNSRRKGLQRMISDIKAGKITVVVIHRLDRLYRNLESLLKFIRLLKRYNVRLVSVTENLTHDFILPDGSVVHFRTKGRPGLFPPGEFKRDSIRDIVRNPYYAGLVARYPSKPLDMEDDPEHPDRRPQRSRGATGNRREPIELIPGKHQALYSVQLWQHNQQLRKNKSFTPASTGRPHREYLLTGIGRCWVCAQYDGREANLRGVTGGKGKAYYRCATVHESYKQRGKKAAEAFEAALPIVGLAARDNGNNLLELHTQASLRADMLGGQVDALIGRLTIPEAWYDYILAYYLTDDGMSHFEREGYNLRQELARHQDMYERGYLTLAQFEQRTGGIVRQLQQLQPSTRPEASEIIPLLEDFPGIWSQMSTGGQRGLLKVMFAGLYFDTGSRLRRALAHEPFGELLGLPEGGVLE